MSFEDRDTAENPTDQAPRLRRSTTKRMLGGVASGIADRFDMDPNIIRAVFIVLMFLWGAGAALYLVLWALVPAADDAGTSLDDRHGEGVDRDWSCWHSVILFAAALCAGLTIWMFVLGGPRYGSGISVVWLVFLVVLAVLSLRQSARITSLRRVLSVVFLIVISLFIIASGAFLGFIASTGVPIAGGVGVKLYEPTSIAEVHGAYRTAFGNMTVDLREVAFAHHTVSVTATVAAGVLVVEVPPGVIVDLSVASGTPRIAYPQGIESFYASPGSTVRSAHLVLNAKVGIGQIRLIRAVAGVVGFAD